MTSFSRGDVVVVDLGMTAKVRPCVVVSVGQPDRQRNMSVVVPMTTEIRGGEFSKTSLAPAGIRRKRAGHRRGGQRENRAAHFSISR
jgi:mRNA-degrading endonuclease toxin of MazEF toxin-antitoxin module